jgi:Tfp pilus assembly protein PilF/predicted O-methyltransferase YrrM
MNVDAHTRLNLGLSHFRAGRLADAERELRAALRSDARHFGALGLLSTVLMLQRKFAEAECFVKEAYGQRPRDITIIYNYASLLRELGRLEEALARFDEAIALQPDDAETWNNRGVVLWSLNRCEAARDSYGKAIEIKPDYALAYNNRGSAMRQLGCHDDALANYDKAIALKPDYADAYNNRGAVLLQCRRYDEALASYDKAIELAPNLADAIVSRTVILRELGRHKEAAKSPWFAQPMNGQSIRTETVRQLIHQCGIARIVETGTFLGATTEFFAEFHVPVTTAEVNQQFAMRAKQRLLRWSNVDLRAQDSVSALSHLVNEPIDHSVPTLFYLDAHWQDYLPLREEVAVAISNFSNALLVIDDFAVPGDPGYGFDDYGSGMRLDLDYLLRATTRELFVFFPLARSDTETGARRGWVIATASAEIVGALRRHPHLREWSAHQCS